MKSIFVPVGSTIFPPIETTSSGASSIASTSAASHPGSGTASLLRKMTFVAVEPASAAARPPVKPRFSVSAKSFTSGCFDVIAVALPSVEPLSTTVIVAPSRRRAALRPRRDTPASRARLFQLTMMISVRGHATEPPLRGGRGSSARALAGCAGARRANVSLRRLDARRAAERRAAARSVRSH